MPIDLARYANGSKSPQSAFDNCLDEFPNVGWEGFDGANKFPIAGGAAVSGENVKGCESCEEGVIP